jgi:hypothetical protein
MSTAKSACFTNTNGWEQRAQARALSASPASRSPISKNSHGYLHRPGKAQLVQATASIDTKILTK